MYASAIDTVTGRGALRSAPGRQTCAHVLAVR